MKISKIFEEKNPDVIEQNQGSFSTEGPKSVQFSLKKYFFVAQFNQ